MKTVKEMSQFLLTNHIRCKFYIHPRKYKITFRVSFKDWLKFKLAKQMEDKHDLQPLGFVPYGSAHRLRALWHEKPLGMQYSVLPLLMPWECREQIAVYSYVD